MLSTLATELAAFGSIVFGSAFFVMQASAFAGGRWWGRRRATDEHPPEGGGVIIGSMLGLLGFVLALTLSHASARFEERRQGTVAEANAIGTAWLRAGAVGHPRGEEIATQLQAYANLRMAFVEAGAKPGVLSDINQRTALLQSEIWRNLSALTRERTDPIAAHLMASLNEAFDRATSERFAFALGIPPQILLLITALPAAGLAAVGFFLGRRRDVEWLLPLILIGMLSCVSTLILDLGAPRVGDIRASTRAYEWTVSGFSPGGLSAPLPR